jgi:hypothetical protein
LLARLLLFASICC